jgi:excisionase family DNA binding protein
LATRSEAVKRLMVSKQYLYKLPRNTPGIYRFGRAIRINLEELKGWARLSAESDEES